MRPKTEWTAPVKVLLHAINDHGGGQYRILQPASLLRRHGLAVTQTTRQPLSTEALTALNPDVVVFQLWQTDQQIETIKRYRSALPHARFVYEIDDLFWAVPEGSFHRVNPLLPKSKGQIKVAAKLCDSIVCTTQKLASAMKTLTNARDVRVIPNEVPHSFVNGALAGRRSDAAIRSDKPRVGWAGGIGHGGDLAIITEVMKLLGDEVQWVFLGMTPPGVDPKTVESYSGVPFQDYAFKLGTLNLDLALAPLEDNDFNAAKSDLRVLEYGAAGYPVLASDRLAYRGCPVTLVGETPEAWAQAIRDALSNREALHAYAENLHAWVLSARCMDDHLAERLKGYLPKNALPFVPHAQVSHVGHLVSVGQPVDGLQNYPTILDAWKAAPGADIFYARPKSRVRPDHVARLVNVLGTNASASVFSNDGTYPVFGRFVHISHKTADRIDLAAQVVAGDPIEAPFPAGPCVLLSGTALARFGLPDEHRFGHVEFAMADWGARCIEGGRGHVTAPNVFVYAEDGLAQVPTHARQTLDHVALWTPGIVALIQNYQSGEALLRAREDLELAYNGMFHEALPTSTYPDWASVYDAVTVRDRDAMAADIETWASRPHINIVMPTFDTSEDFLHAAIASVQSQTYREWSLLIADDASTEPHVREILQTYADADPRIKVVFREENGHICAASNTALEMAEPGWVVFLDHDDVLAPHALYRIAAEVQMHPDARFIYSDSDKLSPAGERVDPYYAPDFSYELLLAQNYVTHLSAYRLEGIHAVGGLRPGMEGSQDWDLVLRYLESECGTPPDPKLIRHIPEVLYHWRQSPTSTSASIMNKPYAIDAGRRAVMQHLQRTNQAAFVSPHPVVPIFNLVRFLVTDPAPKVTVVIPTKDNAEQLLRCVASVLGGTVYGNFDVIVMDNGSTDKAAREALKKVATNEKVRVLHVPGMFNYAAINNVAALQTDAEFICLLNDDTEIIERAWMNDMVGLAARPQVGAVGAKLLYPDNTVQQCGIMFSPNEGPGMSALHMFQRLPANMPGPSGRAVITQPCLAVTGACLLIRRSLYLSMDGLDEETFPVDYNDVDLCLRLHKAGYRNIVCAQALVRHYEGQTKQRLKVWSRPEMLEAEQRLLSLHGTVHDPYVNPNLEFNPHLATLVSVPSPKVWTRGDRRRVLLVNGGEEAARTAFRNGDLPFCASLEGHYLAFTIPSMQHVQPIDVRLDTDRLGIVLSKLAIDRVIFCGIGDGTLGAVGFFTALARKGWPVEYNPVEYANTANDNEYYTTEAWNSVWDTFFDEIQNPSWLVPAAE